MDSVDHSEKLLSLSKDILITRICEKEQIIAEQKKEIQELVYQLAEEKRQNHEIVQKLAEVSYKLQIMQDDAGNVDYPERVRRKDLRLLIRNHSVDSGLSCDDGDATEQSLSNSEGSSSPNTSDEEQSRSLVQDMLVVCTICGSGLPIDDIESHSTNCSSHIEEEPKYIKNQCEPLSKDCINIKNDYKTTNDDKNIRIQSEYETLDGTYSDCNNIVSTINSSNRHAAATVTLAEDMLTSSNQTGNRCFKIMCRAVTKELGENLLVVRRTPDDFVWYRKALINFYPELIIPPLTFKHNVPENLREAQRFLDRVCVHDKLNCSSLSQAFFTYSQIVLENYKEKCYIPLPKRLKQQKPSADVIDEEGLILRSQRYLSNFSRNLDNLIQCVRRTEASSPNELHESFFAMNEGESKDTFFKKVTLGFEETLKNLERKNQSQMIIVEHLASLKDYVQSALNLLSRVQGCIDTYLYWNEEMEVLKQIKDEGLVSQFNEHEISNYRIEVSSKRQIAHEELEKMGETLSDELINFDIQKEREVKQVLSEYAESKIDILKSHQTKWLAMKVLLDTDIDPQSRAIDYRT